MKPHAVALVVTLTLLGAGCTSGPTSTSAPENGAAETVESRPSSTSTAPTTSTAPPTSTVPPTTAPPTSTERPTTTAPPACPEREAGTATYTLEVAGVTYPVAVQVPGGLDVGESAPVVLDWHGLGGIGPLHTAATGFDELAEREGFIVVSATGPPFGESAENAWELPGFEAPGRDDVQFAESLIDDVVTRFCGDDTRVYSIGMSNGGLFTSRLVCELSEKLAAAAAVAGLLHGDDCQPTRAVPFIAFHGTADYVVPFDGTTTPSLLDHPITAAFEELVMAEEFARFAADMGCNPQPDVIEIPPDVLRHDYQDCALGAQLAFYEVTGGGHTWPGSRLWDSTGTVDATEDSWAFFEQFEL